MNKNRFPFFVLFSILAISIFNTQEVGAQSRQLATLKLRNGREIILVENARQWLDSMKGTGWKNGAVQAIIKFAARPSETQKKNLEKCGITLSESLSGDAYIAVLTNRAAVSELPLAPVFITAVQPSWKIIPFPDGLPATGNVAILVGINNMVSLNDLQQKLAGYDGKLLNSPLAANQFYEVSIPAGNMALLASWYGVKSISPVANDQPLNFESTTATKVNIAQLPPASGGYGLLGDGMTIGVGDNTSGVNHVDLRDRIINYNPAPYTNHGMHINGIAGGVGTIWRAAQGFAPHATIVDHLYNLVWARTGTMLQNHNMTVTNNSYAAIVGNCNYSGQYDAYAQALDTLALQYPTVLHVFASGNDGSMNCPPYPLGFGTVTGGYQPSKNVLVVSQADKFYNWGINSSRGPVKDGRLKPEITAIGTGVLSTRGGDNYLVSGGTSMASPQVAGAALLLEQRYKELHSNSAAPSSLIKALLMNGAMDIGNPGPDFTFGFGMMDLRRSLMMLDSNRYATGTLNTGAMQTYNVPVPQNTAQLKVMIYWHDLPASMVSSKQLVNDLDLEVVNPANIATLPLVLDPTPANVNNVAVPGPDHLNNVEQVTIDNPVAGNYTVKVKGYDVSGTGQSYVVVYDFIPTGIELTYPTKGATAASDDSLRIYWDASPDTRAFTLEVSTDNGSNWTILSNNIPAIQRYYVWHPAGISSSQCLMRLTRNGAGQQFTSGLFVLNPTIIVHLAAVQCPGYMNITWGAVVNATGYQVLRKKGPYLQNEAIVTDTTYSFKGLSLDSTYYASVIPIINGTPGYRGFAASRQANTGNCAGSISNGDLMADSLIAPATGRANTSTQLGASQNIIARIRNLDDVAATNYSVAYSVNGGTWISQAFNPMIAANATGIVTLPAALNLSAPGTYIIRLAVKNNALADGVSANDTIVRVVRQLANDPLNLATGFTDGFEGSGAFTLLRDSLGFTPNEHWDFYNSNDTGRLRTLVNNDILISGNRSISLDNYQYARTPVNFLTGTFNTSAYNTASSEVRFEFDYKLHGDPHVADSNRVWVRGADTQPWVPLFRYNLSANPGSVYNSGTISITDALAAAGQNFSSATQLRFGQKDTTVIALNDYGTGLTLDNIKLYSVANDIAVDSIISPKGAACNLSASPVTIRLYNGVSQTLTNIQVSYRLDNGPVVTATVPSLAGKTRLVYTFSQQLAGIAAGPHTISVWASVGGDTYHSNDTLTETFHNQPLITSFPYLENFEAGDGNYFAEGQKSSWQYGAPNAGTVSRAASGTKAWKTNLSGYYNDNELSYLYSPCFDLSSLTAPMLSFSGVLDIEDCGTTLCDAAWIEYTTNGGKTWTKLGASGQGFGWYENATEQVWSRQDNTRWKVRSIALPSTTQPIQFRFVLSSDPGTERTGFSLDDVHIYSRDYGIFHGSTLAPVTQVVSGNQFVNFVQNGNLLAQIEPSGQSIGNTEVNVYAHTMVDTASGQYYLPRSFMINSAGQHSDSVTARLYVLDAEVDSLVKANGCSLCTKPVDVYRLGISKYDDSVQAHENGTLNDNISGTWTFYNFQKVKWVPYDSGYYAELRIPSFSEFWFNDGGPQGNLALPIYHLGEDGLISVYPNPNTNGRINIAWMAGLEKTISVDFIDIVGRIVKKAELLSQNGKNVGVLEAGNLPGSVYFIRCKIGSKLFVQKILFQ